MASIPRHRLGDLAAWAALLSAGLAFVAFFVRRLIENAEPQVQCGSAADAVVGLTAGVAPIFALAALPLGTIAFLLGSRRKVWAIVGILLGLAGIPFAMLTAFTVCH